MRKIEIALLIIIILCFFILFRDLGNEKEEKQIKNSITSTFIEKDKPNKEVKDDGLFHWDKIKSLAEAHDKNDEMVEKVVNACNKIGLTNLDIYNESEFYYPADNKVVYSTSELNPNTFDELIYTYEYKSFEEIKCSYKLTSRYCINIGEFNNNNLFDFNNMPQNELFYIFTGIEDRDVKKINEEINDFLMIASSQFDRYEIVNEYNGIEETIVLRPDTIYYYLKTYDIDIEN